MKPAAILDIGSSKVVCLSGSVLDKGGIVVHGAGVSGCEGYLEQTFPDKQSLHDAIIDAIQKAGENYKSFGGSSDDTDSSVKFIIRTDSIKSL